MKLAADFRRIARDSLRGKWLLAVTVGLVAVILGGTGVEGPQLNIEIEGHHTYAEFSIAGQTLYSTMHGINSGLGHFFSLYGSYITVFAFLAAIVYFILGSIIGVGYARFNTGLVYGEEVGFNALFGYFSHWKTTALTGLLQVLYIFLWSLLLIVPGIMKAYSYAMTDYILADDPELAPSEVLARSEEMMYGNRWRLFCLQISFIGWHILSAVLTFGIGSLFITPYANAATAAFYQELISAE